LPPLGLEALAETVGETVGELAARAGWVVRAGGDLPIPRARGRSEMPRPLISIMS